MEISKHRAQGIYTITLSGKFTFGDHTAFREILQQLAEPCLQQITLNVSRVEFMDSAALGMLLLALDEATKHKKRLVLDGATGQVKKMFDMARFSTLFTLT